MALLIDDWDALVPADADTRAVEETVAALESGQRVLFFIGSWPSFKEAGLPSVPEFLKALWEALGDALPRLAAVLRDGRAHHALHNAPFEAVFAVAEANGTVDLRRHLLGAYALGTPPSFHRLLAQIVLRYPNAELVTTNFDTLFEDAGLGDARFRDAEFAMRDRHPVWKIHGSVGRQDPAIESIVYTLRQTTRGLGQEKSGWLEDRSAHARFVFIGWGANDLDIVPVLRRHIRPGRGDVWCMRPRYDDETEEDYRRATLGSDTFELCAAASGHPHLGGYGKFCAALANRLKLPYTYVELPESARPPWRRGFEDLVRTTDPVCLSAFVSDLLDWLGLPRQAKRVLPEDAAQRPETLLPLARAEFAAGRLRTARRLFQRAYESGASRAIRIECLSKISECEGNRWNPLSWRTSSQAVKLGESAAATDSEVAEAVAFAKLRRAQGFRQIGRIFDRLGRIVRPLRSLGRHYLELAKRDLEAAAVTMHEVGNEYGRQSAARNLRRLTTQPPADLLAENIEIARQFRRIGRRLEEIYVHREIVQLCRELPEHPVTFRGTTKPAKEIAAELIQETLSWCRAVGAWTPYLKSSMDRVFLRAPSQRRRRDACRARRAARQTELGLYAWVQLARLRIAQRRER